MSQADIGDFDVVVSTGVGELTRLQDRGYGYVRP